MARTILTALGLGAAAMYFYDPQQGRRRRHLLRDRFTHVWAIERKLVRQARLDLSNRTDASDQVIAERVRARLGRLVSHPGSIRAWVCDGDVTLGGPVLADEVGRLLRGVAEVKGVRAVIEQLDVDPSAEGIECEPGREVWPPALQVAASVAGGALLLWGLRRRSLVRSLAALAGGALALRGTMNEPWRRILGIGAADNAVFLQKTITIDAPIEEVFALWRRFEELPRFVHQVREVIVDGGGERERSHWVLDGPAGIGIGFDAELTQVVKNRVLAWRTLPEQMIEHTGTVHFEEVRDGTRIEVEMHFAPPAGVLGNTVAQILGWHGQRAASD